MSFSINNSYELSKRGSMHLIIESILQSSNVMLPSNFSASFKPYSSIWDRIKTLGFLENKENRSISLRSAVIVAADGNDYNANFKPGTAGTDDTGTFAGGLYGVMKKIQKASDIRVQSGKKETDAAIFQIITTGIPQRTLWDTRWMTSEKTCCSNGINNK